MALAAVVAASRRTAVGRGRPSESANVSRALDAFRAMASTQLVGSAQGGNGELVGISSGGLQSARFTQRVSKERKFKLPLVPAEEVCPIPKLKRKWRQKLPILLKAWDGEYPPPLQSHDPEIFAAQQRIFGYRDRSLEEDGKTPKRTERKKIERWVRRANAVTEWYMPQEEEIKKSIMKDLKHQRKALLKGGVEDPGYRLNRGQNEDAAEALQQIDTLLSINRYTLKQEERRRKLVTLRRRGKGPPKKGEGKRSKK